MWRFTRPVKLARHGFAEGDPLPPWLSDGPMVRYITTRWPGLLREGVSGSPAPPGASPSDEGEEARIAQQRDDAWREGQEMRERLEPFCEEPTPEEEPDAEVR